MRLIHTVQDAGQLESVALRQLVSDRVQQLQDAQEEGDPVSQCIVLDSSDDDSSLRTQLGVSPFENRYTGRVWGDSEFTPSFELLEEHECCCEFVFVQSDDGSGAIVFVPDGVSFDPRLAALRERYALRRQES